MSLITMVGLAYGLLATPYVARTCEEVLDWCKQPQGVEERVLSALQIQRIDLDPAVFYVSKERIDNPHHSWPRNSTPIPECEYIRLTKPNRYAQPELVEMITSAAGEMFEKYKVNGNGPRLEVRDASRKRGGKLSPHVSHNRGIDVDVGMYWFDGEKYGNSKGLIRKWNPETLEVNWNFLKSLQQHYPVEYVFWSGKDVNRMHNYVKTHYGEEEWKKYGKVLEREDSHTNHFHIRIQNPNRVKGKQT